MNHNNITKYQLVRPQSGHLSYACKHMKNILHRPLVFVLLLLVFTCSLARAEDRWDLDQKRNQLIGYMLGNALPAAHYTHKKMDETLSVAVFNLYLKQLDYQKRFLLSSDVKVLRAIAPDIGANLQHGTSFLPETAYNIMQERLVQVERLVDEIMATGFNVTIDEVYETDPEKLDYAKDLPELKNRWRKIMKEQVIYKCLELEEDQKTEKVKSSDAELWEKATAKEGQIFKEFFVRLHQEKLQDHYDRFFNAIARAYGPHTDYFPPELREQFDIEMRGNLEGVGAILRDENGFNKVVSLVPGGPAAKQGMLQAEDILLQVAENGANPVDISGMRPNDAAQLIRGPKGTQILLTVKKPDGTKRVIPITRDVVEIEETFVKSSLLDAPDGGKIGYIMIPSFYRDFEKTNNGEDARNATDDTRTAIREVTKSNPEGIILDLRNDGGGSLIDAVDITGMFIKSGPVVQVKDSSGQVHVLSDDNDSIEYSGPLIVLVNKFSASASEVVAAALQDYQRAIIVGDDFTYGKGTVQNMINLNNNMRPEALAEFGDLGVLKLTTQKFYRISGGSTQNKGFAPDVVLPSLFHHLQSGEKYLDYSLAWDQIGPADYARFSGETYNIDMIRTMSKERVGQDPDFQTIAKEAKLAKERGRQTAVSLKVADVRERMELERKEKTSLSGQLRSSQAEKYGSDLLSAAGGKDMDKNHFFSWQAELQKDPYLRESVNILVDM